MTDGRVRGVIVDDDDLMRAGLRAVLSSDESIEMVGEAADGRAADAGGAFGTPGRPPDGCPHARPRRHRGHA